MNARYSNADIFFQGVDITEDIRPYLLSVTYTDNEEDETDDLQIKLQDKDSIWLTSWLNEAINAAVSVSGTAAGETNTAMTATVTAKSGLILRAGKSTSSARLTAAPYGASVTVTDSSGNWWACAYNGQSGYMWHSYLSLADGSSGAGQASNISTAGAGSGTYTVNAKSGLILRAGPSKATKRLTAAPYGAKVTVTDSSGDWYACSYGGQNGYMWHSYLTAENSGEEEAVQNPAFFIQAVLHRYNWKEDGTDEALDCGQFELDTVDASGPPAQLTIKASSLPYSSTIRQTKKTKAWEAYQLSGIVDEMAKGNGLASMYLSEYNPLIAREEQTEESDIEFLSRLAHNAGLSVKATNNMLVVFDQMTYEKLEPVAVFKRGDGSYSKYKLNTTQADTQYASCRVCYVNPKGELIEGIAYVTDYDAEAKNNQQLEIRQKVEDIAEAKRLAAKLLRLHNKYTKTASLTVPGAPELVAGVTVSLKGFGAWSGRYMVKQSKHTISGNGYVTQITLRNVLEGY